MNEELLAYLILSHFMGIGPVRFKDLMARFGSAEDICKAKVEELGDCLGYDLGIEFHSFRSTFDPVRKLDELTKKNILVLPSYDKSFPYPLKHIDDTPICLYVKGNIDLYDFEEDVMISIVGTRKSSHYGEYVANYFSGSLATSGCVIVSGMAEGIDGAAHEAALQVGGRTIAFLGCGVDIVYPAKNKELYDNILAHKGLIISEFPPGMTVQKGLFIARNRLISGISKAVLLVEGEEDSGALRTAHFAANQGREVYVPSMNINVKLAEAPLKLYEDGAKVVMTPEFILYDLQVKPLTLLQKDMISDLQEDECCVIQEIERAPCTIDELVEKLMWNIAKVTDLTTALELKGAIKIGKDGKYHLI